MSQAPQTIIDLSRLTLAHGEGKRLEVPVALERFELAGQTYKANPVAPKVRLEVSRPSNGFAFRLNFPVHLEGPCMRCLEPAARGREGGGRGLAQAGAAGPRPPGRGARDRPGRDRRPGTDQPLRLRRRARHRPLGPRRDDPRPPDPHPLPPRLRRPLPDLRRVPQRQPARARAASRRPLGGAEGPETGVIVAYRATKATGPRAAGPARAAAVPPRGRRGGRGRAGRRRGTSAGSLRGC